MRPKPRCVFAVGVAAGFFAVLWAAVVFLGPQNPGRPVSTRAAGSSTSNLISQRVLSPPILCTSYGFFSSAFAVGFFVAAAGGGFSAQ